MRLSPRCGKQLGVALGIGTIWTLKGLLAGANTTNPTFKGTNAKKAYGGLKGTGPAPVPVENIGGPGTKNSHWRETVFKNKLMSGCIAAPGNPLSKVTTASLKDLGYVVNMNAAEPYSLPNLLQFAERRILAARAEGEHDRAHALPVIPVTLPKESLDVGAGA